jgi:hypothetical protein
MTPMFEDEKVKGFVKVGDQQYRLVYSRGLSESFSTVEHQASLLIPLVEQIHGEVVHTLFVNEDALNPGRVFSIRFNFVKREGER